MDDFDDNYQEDGGADEYVSANNHEVCLSHTTLKTHQEVLEVRKAIEVHLLRAGCCKLRTHRIFDRCRERHACQGWDGRHRGALQSREH